MTPSDIWREAIIARVAAGDRSPRMLRWMGAANAERHAAVKAEREAKRAAAKAARVPRVYTPKQKESMRTCKARLKAEDRARAEKIAARRREEAAARETAAANRMVERVVCGMEIAGGAW